MHAKMTAYPGRIQVRDAEPVCYLGVLSVLPTPLSCGLPELASCSEVQSIPIGYNRRHRELTIYIIWLLFEPYYV